MSYLGTSYIRVRPDSSGFEGEAKKSVLGTIGKVAAGAGALFAGFKAFDFVKDSVIGFNSTLEQSRSAFTNLLGSGKAANKMLADLQQFAKTTPFAFEQLIPVSQQLVGALGKNVDVTATMTQLGDAISATGGSADKLNQLTLAYTQMATSGTAHLGDLMQINNAVPGALARMAKAGGMSVGQFRESVSKGMVSSGDAIKLFKKVTTDPKYGIAGGMEAQSKTFQGAMSNIGDALQQGLASAGQPIFAFVSAAAKGFAQFLAIWQDTGSIFGSEMDQFFGTFTGGTAILFGLRSIVQGFQLLVAGVQAAIPIIAAVMSHLVTAFNVALPIVQALINFIMGHTEIFGAIAAGIAIATVAIFGLAAAMVVGTAVSTAFGAALAFAFSPIVIIVVAIGLLVGALIYLYRNNETARTIMQAAWAAIGSIITSTIALVRSVISNGAAFIRAVWDRVGSTIVALTMNYFHTIQGVISGVLNVIRGIINVFLGVIHGNWSQVWKGIQQITSGALGILKSLLQGAIGAMGILASNIGRAILNGIVNGVKGVGSKVWALIKGIPSALGNVGSLLVNAGVQLITGFITGITSKIGDVKDTLGGLAHDAVGWKGPPSYDRKVLINNGQLMMAGFLDGLQRGIPDIRRTMQGVAPMAARVAVAAPGAAPAARPTMTADIGGKLDRIAQLLADRVTVGEVTVYSDTQNGRTVGRDLLRELTATVQR